MNSLYIMSKQSKVVDVSVCHSCCSLDLKAGEKGGWRKITCACDDVGLSAAFLHVAFYFVCLFCSSVALS